MHFLIRTAGHKDIQEGTSYDAMMWHVVQYFKQKLQRNF